MQAIHLHGDLGYFLYTLEWVEGYIMTRLWACLPPIFAEDKAFSRVTDTIICRVQ
jgi:hypothetical protein